MTTRGGLAAVTEVVEDVDAAVRSYCEVLSVPVDHKPGSGCAIVETPGVLHFCLRSRESAADATAGGQSAAVRIPHGFSLESDVDSVRLAADAISGRGWRTVQTPTRQGPTDRP